MQVVLILCVSTVLLACRAQLCVAGDAPAGYRAGSASKPPAGYRGGANTGKPPAGYRGSAPLPQAGFRGSAPPPARSRGGQAGSPPPPCREGDENGAGNCGGTGRVFASLGDQLEAEQKAVKGRKEERRRWASAKKEAGGKCKYFIEAAAQAASEDAEGSQAGYVVPGGDDARFAKRMAAGEASCIKEVMSDRLRPKYKRGKQIIVALKWYCMHGPFATIDQLTALAAKLRKVNFDSLLFLPHFSAARARGGVPDGQWEMGLQIAHSEILSKRVPKHAKFFAQKCMRKRQRDTENFISATKESKLSTGGGGIGAAYKHQPPPNFVADEV